MAANCLVARVCALGVSRCKAQLFGCVQVLDLLTPFKYGGVTTHLTAHNTDDDQEQEQQQKNKEKTWKYADKLGINSIRTLLDISLNSMPCHAHAGPQGAGPGQNIDMFTSNYFQSILIGSTSMTVSLYRSSSIYIILFTSSISEKFLIYLVYIFSQGLCTSQHSTTRSHRIFRELCKSPHFCTTGQVASTFHGWWI